MLGTQTCIDNLYLDSLPTAHSKLWHKINKINLRNSNLNFLDLQENLTIKSQQKRWSNEISHLGWSRPRLMWSGTYRRCHRLGEFAWEVRETAMMLTTCTFCMCCTIYACADSYTVCLRIYKMFSCIWSICILWFAYILLYSQHFMTLSDSSTVISKP